MLRLTKYISVRRMTKPENRHGTEAPLRQKNQVTLPAQVAEALGAVPGDRLVFTLSADAPGTAVVRRIRESYFGAIEGAYGSTHDEQLDYVRTEQGSWGE
jgi:bifunctional DNA-binding transcriptional regulator/antitoxin component of YhaV-PrlF toxin-antitoxin module